MKGIWKYLTAFFAGVSLALLAALKWFAGDDIKVIIRKIKNKGISGTSDIDIPITIDKPPMGLKQRRADRLTKRIEKKKAKVERRLEKLL